MVRRLWRDGPRIPSLILFALVAASLLGGMVAVFKTLSVEGVARNQVERSTAIIAAIRDTNRKIIDAETGQRGYIITADPLYLAPYLRGRQEWPESQARLERLFDDSATTEQTALLLRARHLGNEKLIELEQTVNKIEHGQMEAARNRVKTNDGLRLMREYRSVIRQLEQSVEEALLAETKRAHKFGNRLPPILISLVIVMVAALCLAIWQMFRVARSDALAAAAKLLEQQCDRADLLSRELNHRVKNLFAVIQAIVNMSLRTEKDTAVAAKKVSERIQALSLAHNVTQGHLETPVTLLEDLVRTALAPYENGVAQLTIAGPPVEIIAKQITPLGLILHELVTNCVKYGAWSGLGGVLTIRWSISSEEDRCVDLEWIEELSEPLPEFMLEGFGTRMIAASAKQLEGTIKREFDETKMRVMLSFATR